MQAYRFDDIAGEHYLLVGPGGFSFATLDSDYDSPFVVLGEVNAMSFEAWIRNEHRIFVKRKFVD